jgi:hypothetical protein
MHTSYWTLLRDGRGGTGPYVEVADVADVRATGYYNIVTPDECIALGRKFGALDLHPLVGGTATPGGPTVVRAHRARSGARGRRGPLEEEAQVRFTVTHPMVSHPARPDIVSGTGIATVAAAAEERGSTALGSPATRRRRNAG